jgi:hypothetical protein
MDVTASENCSVHIRRTFYPTGIRPVQISMENKCKKINISLGAGIA